MRGFLFEFLSSNPPILANPVQCTLLVSVDRDLSPEEIPRLKSEYGALAGDWESGAIAYVSACNHTRCLILRGVTDLVGSGGGEAYDGQIHVYAKRTATVMKELVPALPAWLARARLGGAQA